MVTRRRFLIGAGALAFSGLAVSILGKNQATGSVFVKTLGGTLRVSCNFKLNEVELSGPVSVIFSGKLS